MRKIKHIGPTAPTKLLIGLALAAFMLMPAMAQATVYGCKSNNKTYGVTSLPADCIGLTLDQCGQKQCELACGKGNCQSFTDSATAVEQWAAENKAAASSATQSGTAASTFKGVNLINPIGGNSTNTQGITDIPTIIGRAISIMTGVVGALALLMFVYGSFVLMTSQGVPDKVDRGKKVMIQAVIGLAVIFTAYAVIKLLFSTLGVS